MLGGFRVARRPIRIVGVTSIDRPPEIASPAIPAQRRAALVGVLRSVRWTPWAVCVISAVAAALRFAELDDVGSNPFYDTAVRSMSLSWHNFLFAAFDPGAVLSIDKPPLDLWLQVASVKLFGWNPAALKLPEALGGTLAVPLLYDAVRRAAGRPAGLAAATTLAVLPESVLTSRSDTMDSLMMLLVVAALWLTIYAVSSGRRGPVILAGVALGLAFNVKLLEALIAAPALLVLYVLAARMPWRRKLQHVLLSGCALVGVGLSWAVAVSLAPGRHPFPIGSADGTVWNVMFVFNGFGRASRTALDHRPGGPGLLRLFQSSSWRVDVLLGCVLIAALALGVMALLLALARRRKLGPAGPPTLAAAFAVSLLVWIAVAVALFSHVAILHARYLEAFTPALAAAIGYGAASLAGLRDWRGRAVMPSVVAIAVTLGVVCAYILQLEPETIGWAAVGIAVAATGGALLARAGGSRGHAAKWLTLVLIVACTSLFPVHESLSLIRRHASDSTGLFTSPEPSETALRSYLAPRTVGTRYELVVDDALVHASLLIHDQRPILPLTSWEGRPVIKPSELYSAIKSGAVRYAVIGTHVCSSSHDSSPACAPTSMWVRRNGLDVSSAAGVGGGERLYLLLPY